MTLEHVFATLNVSDDDEEGSPCCCSTSPERRKKRRLNAPAQPAVPPPVEEPIKRSSNRPPLRRGHSHHMGDCLRDFYGEVAPSLTIKGTSKLATKARRRSSLVGSSSSAAEDDTKHSTTQRQQSNASWFEADKSANAKLHESIFRGIVRDSFNLQQEKISVLSNLLTDVNAVMMQ